VYRIVQEALTNALKHARTAAGAEVDLDASAGRVRVQITDSGATPSPSEASGHGLVGIRQRAALYNGTVHIGPRTDGPGWVVDVLLDAPAKGTAR
jgi:signal transduction histidine kinase